MAFQPAYGQQYGQQQQGPAGAYPPPTPVVMGTVAPQTVPYSGPVVQGVPYRVQPEAAHPGNIPLLAQFPEKRQEAKLNEIRGGAEVARNNPPFPESRPWRDVIWIVPFLLVFAAGAVTCAIYVSKDTFKLGAPEGADGADYPSVPEIVGAGVAAGVASLVVAFLYMQLARACPGCVVWTSLLLGPSLTIAIGVALCAVGASAGGGTALVVMGLALILVGCCSLFCIFFCWRDLIPFMIKLVEVVAEVIVKTPGTFLVSLFGSALGIAWALIMGLAFFGVYVDYQENVEETSRGIQYAIYFVVALVFIWGGLVANNLCHVTYCGVFGRWYFAKDEGRRLSKSFRAAITTSFGSVCFGSFIIAAVRAIEVVVRQMRRDQQEEGNIACCILLLVVECIVSCIGDLLEYFSEWAYVQVAVRGVDFLSAVKVTYSMMTCSNIDYILQDLLLDSVVSMGALLCAAVAVAAGGGVGYALGSVEKALAGAVIGLFAGLVAGGTSVGIISSGVKTILALWAEDPTWLQKSRPDVHDEFHSRIMAKWGH